MNLSTIMRVGAWVLLAALIVMTLGPIQYRPRTVLPVDIERAGAFFAVGLAFALAYPNHVWWAVLFVITGTIGLEWLQNFRPDRHGREGDAIVKIAGASIGLAIGWLLATSQEARSTSKRTNRKPGS